VNVYKTQQLAALLNNYRDALHAIDVGPCSVDNKREEAVQVARTAIFSFFEEYSSVSANGDNK